MKTLFANALRPSVLELRESRNDRWDYNLDGKADVDHFKFLWWQSGEVNYEYTRNNIIKKEQYPGRGGLSYSYLVDGNSIIISFDSLNGEVV